MKVTLTEEFLDEMAELPKPIGKRCRDEIRKLLRSKGTAGLSSLERLTNSPLSRIRIGNYRILLEIEGQMCVLSGVDDRGSVYSHLERKHPSGASCEVVRKPRLATAAEPFGWDLDKIIARLNEQNQRASYGAIAGFLGGGATARYLMDGRPRSPENSWVVAAGGKFYGQPSRYEEKDIHGECRRQIRERPSDFIQDPEVLAGWLRAKRS
jgi:mRNA-degrading endonuclease RelE of RelBE toxin-antitoxin system